MKMVYNSLDGKCSSSNICDSFESRYGTKLIPRKIKLIMSESLINFEDWDIICEQHKYIDYACEEPLGIAEECRYYTDLVLD